MFRFWSTCNEYLGMDSVYGTIGPWNGPESFERWLKLIKCIFLLYSVHSFLISTYLLTSPSHIESCILVFSLAFQCLKGKLFCINLLILVYLFIFNLWIWFLGGGMERIGKGSWIGECLHPGLLHLRFYSQ